MDKRGSILLHVLVTGVVVALMAACLLRVAMLRYEVTARAQVQGQERRDDDGALARLMSAFNANNGVCGAVAAASGYSCNGAVGTCTCTCTPLAATDPTVTLAGGGGGCQMTIKSSDRMSTMP